MKTAIAKFIKSFVIGVLSILALSVGAIAIGLERQSVRAQEDVKSWTQSQCQMVELDYHSDYFQSLCTYEINGVSYQVKRQSPVWNQYFNMISGDANAVEVFYIDFEGGKYRFRFEKGMPAGFLYNPNDPADSVLMPGAGSLRGFLYFGIGYYVLLAIGLIGGLSIRHKSVPHSKQRQRKKL